MFSQFPSGVAVFFRKAAPDPGISLFQEQQDMGQRPDPQIAGLGCNGRMILPDIVVNHRCVPGEMEGFICDFLGSTDGNAAGTLKSVPQNLM